MGETLAAEQAIRADLTELGGPPTTADLRQILADRAVEGVRYLAVLDRRDDIIAAAGTPVLATGGKERELGTPRRLVRRASEGNGRIRLEWRATFRRGSKETK